MQQWANDGLIISFNDSGLISAFAHALNSGDDRYLYGAYLDGGHQFVQIDRSGNFWVPYTNTRLDKKQFLSSFGPSFGESLLDALSVTGGAILDGFQLALDGVGLVPGVGEIADGANALIYAGRGDYTNAALSGAAMVPFLGYGATGAKYGNKAHKVYQAVDAAGNVKYVGITSRNVTTRAAEHMKKPAFQGLEFGEVAGDLSKIDARKMEQTFINQFGLGKKGGQLLNQINSIAPSKWGMYGIKP
jgi:hypothetical protein